MEWSSHQKNIFDFIENGEGNGIAVAVAGSGKTTTIVEGLKRLEFVSPDNIFLAFNKSIAEELKKRGVNAKTFHSLTFSAVTRHLGIREITTNKTFKIIRDELSFNDRRMYGSFINRLVGVAKQVGIGCLTDDTEMNWLKLVNHFSLELDSDYGELNEAVSLSRHIFNECDDLSMCDFDDLLYIAVREGIKLPEFDFVFVDEAQDTNAIQRAILHKIMRPESRMMAVGDPAQAIYGFRGSDNNSLQLIAGEFNCKEFPLTISYRCPTKIVEYARTWVPHIEAAPGAKEGEVIDNSYDWKVEDFKEGDLIICRTNAPIITLAYKILKNKLIAPNIAGREIGVGLVSLINQMGAEDIDNLLVKLDAWHVREVERARVKDQDYKIEQVTDRYESILCLIESLDENNRTVPKLIETIDYLFSIKDRAVNLSSIHKAKGLEADNVYWLNRSMCPATWVKKPWEKEQENNLCYVAATRAKKKLIMIEE